MDEKDMMQRLHEVFGPREGHLAFQITMLSATGQPCDMTFHTMPKDRFTEAQLAAVDLAEAEDKVGPNGETLRKMIGDTYRCASKEQEDRYLRRFIAS